MGKRYTIKLQNMTIDELSREKKICEMILTKRTKQYNIQLKFLENLGENAKTADKNSLYFSKEYLNSVVEKLDEIEKFIKEKEAEPNQPQ